MSDIADKSVRYRTFVDALGGAQCDLRAYVSYLLGNTAAVDDVVQETNLTLCQEWERYDATRPFLPWAKTLAYYQVMTYLKTASREKVLFDETVVDFLAVMDTRAEDGEAVADRQLHWLEEGIKTLPQRDRSLINFRYRHRYTLIRLSRRYQMSVATLSLVLIGIRKKLGVFITVKMREEGKYGL